MMRLPHVFGLILCKEMAVDVAAGQMSLVGITHAIRCPTFPSPVSPFTVYAALYDGTGEGIMELICTRLETEADVYRYRRWCAFPGGGMVLNLEIPVRQCIFPAPGRYSLSLLFEKQELGQRYFDVTQRDR